MSGDGFGAELTALAAHAGDLENTAEQLHAARSAAGTVQLESGAYVSTALARLPPAPGTTYRAVQYRDHVLARYEPGQVVTEHAFTSTSRDPGVSQMAYRNTIMTITGRNGRDLAPFSAHPEEAESPFDYGIDFLVTSKRWDAELGKWLITLEEVQ